jgi:hypothetical protein
MGLKQLLNGALDLFKPSFIDGQVLTDVATTVLSHETKDGYCQSGQVNAPELIGMGLSLGINAFTGKPVNPEAIQPMVKGLVNLFRGINQLRTALAAQYGRGQAD